MRIADNGYKDVQFHVQVQRFLFTKEGICHIIKTITAILDCQEEDILQIGARNSLSGKEVNILHKRWKFNQYGFIRKF